VARGSAVADFDRDGDPDIAVNCLNSPVALLQNESGGDHGWLRIELVGQRSNRGGVGAVVQCGVGERTQVRCVQAGGSYLSCDEAGVLFGLGASQQAPNVTVTWPSGRRETWAGLAAKQTYRLLEGAGQELPRP
jgi:enediyne biosynthesis protein E4